MSGDVARVVVEADGGSRGNPGPAAYGALIRDAGTGRVLAEAAEGIGVATNNVAEYQGLIAGLRLAGEYAPGAEVEVRMDSKLVIEQMAGRWKVKHPDMRPLALQARRLAPAGTTWTWVPRERNRDADALLNKILDGGPPVWRTTSDVAHPAEAAEATRQGWSDDRGTPTTLLLLRHGETELTVGKRFSGLGGSDPALTPRGREQMTDMSRMLAARGGIDAIVSSPLRRARQSAEILAAGLGLKVEEEDGLAEAAFGDWDGLTYAEIGRRWPAELAAWRSSAAQAPPGGESFDALLGRVRRARDRLVRTYPGRTVLVVSHVTPIKLLTCLALGVPTDVIFRMELAPASVTELRWYADGTAALYTFGAPPQM